MTDTRYKLAGNLLNGFHMLYPGKVYLFWRGHKIIRVPGWIRG